MLTARCGHSDIMVELVKGGAKLDLQDKVKLAISAPPNHCYHSHHLHSGWRLSCHQSYSETATIHSDRASEGRE